MFKHRSVRAAAALVFLSITLTAVTSGSVFAGEDEQIKVLMDEYGAGKYDAAFRRCIAILRANSKNMTAHYFMGNLYLKYNRLDEATAEYKYCLGAAPDGPEAQAAQQGLQAVDQRRAAPAPSADSTSEPPQVDAKVQEQIDRLRKEAEDQVAGKKKILDANIARANQEMADQVPRYRIGGIQGSLAWRETQQELLKEKQDKVDRFTKDFERNKKEINDACDRRVNDMLDAQKNIQRRKATGH